MMKKLLFLLGFSILASGCNQADAFVERQVDRLITRFDATDCEDARFERFGRLPDEEGEGVINAFGISEACAEDIRVGLAEGGFKETGPLTYLLTLPSGSRETVLIRPGDVMDDLKVEWRVFD
ncbi:hypothetical protein [Aurantiacibacter marinus]|uniref:Lipoprotein n=1 Tax=Aurantiacibacter marinus TaxID=874156 RepID=A0A0H0XU56_9SPHN|nr:hypothetical protein [Aurantiacibacter marinus]KLI63800.1 hypothetical protein AAV99_08815 [Aurantiacibacter marinus]